jgi:kinesin family protein 6/9
VFPFDQLFDQSTSQEKIFDKVAKEVIDSALEGYNGTLFAYGQTGSGKTFTMTGDSENYSDRGIIPRTISYIFSKRRDKRINVTLSYFQIYEEHGYDLLDAENETKKLSDLKKMQVLCSANGQMEIRNLSMHNVENEEDALNLLFMGNVNRVMSKTPMNDESTRSHCIFMIKLEVSEPGSDIKSEAFVHLVDLSGSERIKLTGVEGLLEKEASVSL